MARETWGTRIGFILAAVGSAIGLGNIWRFPFQVSQEGGAAFMVMYLAFVLLIGFPAMLAEFVVGRKTELNAVGGIREFAGGMWSYLGGLFVFIGFVILSYYSVIGGWVLRYVVGSFTGGYVGTTAEGAPVAQQYFGQISTGMDTLLFHAIFMAIVIGVVAVGVKQGIELAVKVMVPAIFLIFGILAVYAFTLGGAGQAYAYYLSPDLGYILANWKSLVPAAAGQGFFTLSLGMGVMITYASYLDSDENLALDGVSIVALNTGISIITGLIVFPILFTAGIDPATSGPGALFVSIASALGDLPFGRGVGFLFFLTVFIAALSSAISLIEVVVSYAIDEFQIDRIKATSVAGIAIFLLGAPVTTDLVFVDLYDIFAAQILLVLGGVLLMISITWVNADQAVEELQKGIGDLGALGTLWIWMVRIPVVVVLLISLYLGITGYIEFLQGPFAEYLASL
ncbi:sodium-dependent transporter [Halanaeroarchaeum sulfurireducens]|uniref:SNF family Na+-dependent transporter n=1 Tax=Halanaeroarchaeum sulfurireducens TaxID=1604004 RepID=A0A0F7PC75_9EURY|nr:sodium-dependent transporter [Halanaeroarchaeum sulfurireducens]AKH96953.1 SNF family Na+-dependent transporter [Halanaeroarchaeum sulfurireducens]ALG81354.1 SNF family Na+-dependent transporter [Halanaeroarchaeum sulfurireducens]